MSSCWSVIYPFFLFCLANNGGSIVEYDETLYGYANSGLYATDIYCEEDAYNFADCNYTVTSQCSGTPLTVMCNSGNKRNTIMDHTIFTKIVYMYKLVVAFKVITKINDTCSLWPVANYYMYVN